MVKPAMYRDTPLYYFMALAVLGLAPVHVVGRAAMATATIQVTFAGSCCEGTECPVAAALDTGSDLIHRYAESETTITVQANKRTSPRRLWEAVEAAQRKPLRLISGDREFVSTPNR